MLHNWEFVILNFWHTGRSCSAGRSVQEATWPGVSACATLWYFPPQTVNDNVGQTWIVVGHRLDKYGHILYCYGQFTVCKIRTPDTYLPLYGTSSDPVVSQFHQNHSFSPNFPRQFFFPTRQSCWHRRVLYIPRGIWNSIVMSRLGVGVKVDRFGKAPNPVVSQYCRST